MLSPTKWASTPNSSPVGSCMCTSRRAAVLMASTYSTRSRSIGSSSSQRLCQLWARSPRQEASIRPRWASLKRRSLRSIASFAKRRPLDGPQSQGHAYPAIRGSFTHIRPTRVEPSDRVSGERIPSGLDEGQQIGVDRLGLSDRHAVRESGVGLQCPVLHELRGKNRGVLIGDDLVVLSVHEQRRNVDLLQIIGEVSLGELLDAVVGRLDARLHAEAPELISDGLGDLGVWPVVAEERHARVLVELGPVLNEAGAKSVEDRQIG